MKQHQTYLIILLLATMFVQSCANDNKKASQQAPVTNVNPAVSETTAPNDNLQTSKENNDGKSVTDAAQNSQKGANTAPIKEEKKPGPPGFVTRENVFLLSEPRANASKICPLKLYQIVSIVETLMTNEQGKMTDYPTWYKVELENKKRGWVIGNSLSAGGGG